MRQMEVRELRLAGRRVEREDGESAADRSTGVGCRRLVVLKVDSSIAGVGEGRWVGVGEGWAEGEAEASRRDSCGR